ncbi:FMN-binding negative transcriptional regulator [Limnochorda pilosa]|uniref:Transcriptional regulator n=1 Tax=Limnochorda pilosa TaxID=1555112 RepID=A0A0K2SIE6_LIMPI|nr:FMN-binding negative transcriptional regulator [Limnochorda pilosa]BAS26860.1 transcriptional regulator [Limnochorda pilosa]
MYVPKRFAETRLEALQELIGSCPFGTLITMTTQGLEANHIPFVLKADPGPYGALQGHVAQANSQWKDFDPDVEALVVFQGPQAYISPSWYPTIQETGKVVPTWNYMVVHAYGKLRVIQDQDWLQRHVEELTDQQERRREEPWHVSDAPPEFTTKLMHAIVGVEIHVSRLVGKWKLGQNRSIEDQMGLMKGLSMEDDADALSMARYLREHERG